MHNSDKSPILATFTFIAPAVDARYRSNDPTAISPLTTGLWVPLLDRTVLVLDLRCISPTEQISPPLDLGTSHNDPVFVPGRYHLRSFLITGGIKEDVLAGHSAAVPPQTLNPRGVVRGPRIP